MADRLRVAVLGGGVSLLSLAAAVAADEVLSDAGVDLVVHARRPERTATIAAAAGAVAAPNREDALAGADVVVNLVRVGGAAARGDDEANCAWRGAPGDEGLGPGGVANARRTAPFTRDLAAAIVAAAPSATVLNLAAPLGVTTRILCDAGLAGLGLCELPLVTEQRLRAAGAPPTGYVGINHLGLFVASDPADADQLAAAAEREGLARVDTVERLGGVPLPYYHRVVRPDLGEQVGIRTPRGRAGQLAALSDSVVAAISEGADNATTGIGDRATPWFDLATVPALRAVATGQPVRLAVNVANDRGGRLLVPWLHPDSVVEVLADWSPAGLVPEPLPPLGRGATRWLTAVADADRLTHDAAVAGDDDSAVRALAAWEALDPPAAVA